MQGNDMLTSKMRIFHPGPLALFGSLMALFMALYAVAACAADLSFISKDRLKGMLDNPEIAVIDVRSSTDWRSSDVKIKGAVRRSPKNFESWAYDFAKDKMLIFY